MYSNARLKVAQGAQERLRHQDIASSIIRCTLRGNYNLSTIRGGHRLTMSNYNDNEGCGSCLYLLLCLVVSIILGTTGALKNCSNSSSSSSSTSGSTYGRPWKKKAQEYEKQRLERERQEYQRQQMLQNAQRYQNIQPMQPTYSGHSGSPRSNYQQLWDECEDLEAALNDAGIDHESLSYPMDYHDLEDLRDEYQSLLEDNDVDY